MEVELDVDVPGITLGKFYVNPEKVIGIGTVNGKTVIRVIGDDVPLTVNGEVVNLIYQWELCRG